MTREKTDPKKHAAIAFAKAITERITKAKHDGTCRDFALIAAPRFLGIIRESLSAMGNAVPFLTIDKEVVGQDTAFIEKLLDAQW
jgi:protein required for attachment to host cells